MKYNELIQFDPIDEIIKFSKLENADYRAKVAREFVCSQSYIDSIIKRICADLDLNSTTETKGIQIVGNYGTGKSHLMSLFTIIAEDEQYLPMVRNDEARKWLKAIAGKYKVKRFELGNTQDLWDIVVYRIDQALEEWGVDYSLADDTSNASYSEKLQNMLEAFEEKYPDKGFLFVIDEMLSYLEGRTELGKLNVDLPVLQALGQVSDRSHFRMVFGVQEMIYQSPKFQFAAQMLSHVSERFLDLTITKEDVQFIAQQRLLLKDEHQKQRIREHLAKFTDMFPILKNDFEAFVNLFPVHPSYFENFALIRIGKSQREVLKTLSQKFQYMLDSEVPDDSTGIVCYDSYWADMLSNSDLKNTGDIRKVSGITAIIESKINDNFVKGLAPKKPLARRIVAAAAIKMLQADLDKQNGVTPEALVNDLLPVNAIASDFDGLVDVCIQTLYNIVKSTLGQYFEKGEGNEYHIRIEGGVNYEQIIKDYAAQMNPSNKDQYFYQFLAEALPVEANTYRTGFKIWEHNIEWLSHKCQRKGYIFMGHPSDRSTTQPQRNFYIVFLPIFDNDGAPIPMYEDTVYFLMDNLSQEFRDMVSLYGAATAQHGSASTDEKPHYDLLRKKYFKAARDLFNQEFLQATQVDYMGEKHPMAGMQGADADSKIDAVSGVTAHIMEPQFEAENPHYPKFTALPQPLTRDNRDNLLRGARTKIANPTQLNRNAEAILMGLGLWKDGRLSTDCSDYARSLKLALEAKGPGKVLNRDEILELFWADTNEYVTKDFHIEADLELLVIGTMIALGEIELTLNGGGKITASKISDFANLAPQDAYTFQNICPPKDLNLPLIRELMLGILGIDRTGDLDTPNTDVFARLIEEGKKIQDDVATMMFHLQNGLKIAGNIEVISPSDVISIRTALDRLKGFSNLTNYNTKAKMRNINWPVEEVKKTMTETKPMLERLKKFYAEVQDLAQGVGYLRSALTNIPFGHRLKDDINDAIDALEGLSLDSTDQERNRLRESLEEVKNRYIDFYLKEYLDHHVREVDCNKIDLLRGGDEYQVCEALHSADFINPGTFDAWLNRMRLLNKVDPRVSRDYLKQSPAAPDGFNPKDAQQPMPSIEQVKDDLKAIYDAYKTQINEIAHDPTVLRNMDILNPTEQTILSQFQNGEIGLTRAYVHPIMEIISKLQTNVARVEVNHDDLLQVFSRPMTREQAIEAFTQFVNNKFNGAGSADVRFIIK